MSPETPNVHGYFDHTVMAEAGDRISHQFVGPNGPYLQVDIADLEPRLARHFRGYHTIGSDLRSAGEYLERAAMASIANRTVETEALFAAAVMAYGRCFAASDDHGVTLNNSPHWIGSEGDSHKWHGTLIDLRNQLVAHSGTSEFKGGRNVLLFEQIGHSKKYVGLGHIQIKLNSPDDEYLGKTSNFVAQVLKRVEAKLEELHQRIDRMAREKYQDRS